MNYRHAFHAGNFADVLKHAVAALIIEHLKRKETPFRVIDTHAGTGIYDLASDEARRTGEWRDGIGRLLGRDAQPIPADVLPILAPYLHAVRRLNADGDLRIYPGSPLLALSLCREFDRLIANELHPEDRGLLQQALARDPRAKVLGIDGWQALRANLPPKERRGLILIDPPFEEPGEFDRTRQGLTAGVARFATGTYMIWFPIKDLAAVASFKTALAKLNLPKLLWSELRVVAPTESPGLTATGLAILNPPFTLRDQLQTLLPFLAARLARGKGASCGCEFLG